MLGGQFPPLPQRRHDDGRGRHAEAEAENRRRFPGHMDKEDKIRGQHGRGNQHLRRSQAKDQTAHGPDFLGAHFQTHGEQKQHHTELRDALQLVYRVDRDRSRGVRPNDNTGDNEAQYRPEAESLEQDDAYGRCRKKDYYSKQDGWEIHRLSQPPLMTDHTHKQGGQGPGSARSLSAVHPEGLAGADRWGCCSLLP